MTFEKLMEITLELFGQNKVLSQCLLEGAKASGGTQKDVERFYIEVNDSMDKQGLLIKELLKADFDEFVKGLENGDYERKTN